MGALALGFLIRATGGSLFGMSLMALMLSRHNVGYSTRPSIEFVPIVTHDLSPHTRYDPEVNPFTSPAVVNGREAEAPPHGFSRHKEDVHAYRDYFHRIRNGTFVDVGAGDGFNGSTSLLFEAFLGWKGLAIEADPAAFERLVVTRPAAVKLQAPVCSVSTPVHFLQSNESTGIGSGILEFMPLASLDATQHNRMEDEDEAGGDVGPLRLATVRCVTLEEVLDQLGLQRVSFLAVDVAGAELSVLESIDYSKVLIDVIAIATRTGGKRRAYAAVKFLEARHYVMEKQLDHTLWFTSQKFRPSQQP